MASQIETLKKSGLGLKTMISFNYAKKLILRLAGRAYANSGTFENELCSYNSTNLPYTILKDATFLLTPTAYKESKVYSTLPANGNGDLTWTRAGGDATRVNSAGNIERVCYNLFQRSEEFDNAIWVKNNVSVTPNTIISHNGLINADSLIGNGVSGFHAVQFSNSWIGGQSYMISIYVKKNTNNFLQLIAPLAEFGTNSFANFDINNGVIGTIGSAATATISNAGNGWFRCTLTVIATASGGNVCSFSLITAATSPRVEVNTLTTSLYIWGAQLVEGSVPKDYFPTTDRLNVPRINYPIGGGCPSILLEPQRTNLYVSSTPNNTTWERFGTGVGSLPTITENNAISPDGTNNASSISLNLNGGTTIGDRVWIKHSGLIAVTNGSSYRASFYVKAKNAADVGKKINVITENLSSNPNITVTLTNNWVRYDFGGVAASTTVVYLFQSRGTLGTSDQVEFLLWGVQFEQGAYVTSLIPTTTAAVTRNADTYSLANVYTNGLISASGGSWYVELENNLSFTRDAAAAFSLSVDSGGSTNAIRLIGANPTGRIQILKVVAGVNLVVYGTLTDTVKMLMSWNGTGLDVFVNGVKVVTGSPFTLTAFEYLMANSLDTPKNIKKMYLLPYPVSDAQGVSETTL